MVGVGTRSFGLADAGTAAGVLSASPPTGVGTNGSGGAGGVGAEIVHVQPARKSITTARSARRMAGSHGGYDDNDFTVLKAPA